MSNNLAHLVYVSNARGMVTHEGIRELVRDSAQRNLHREVTGALLYGNRHFMQLLEGDLYTINELFLRIAKDCRHHHVTRIAFYPVPRRYFPDWSMELINLEDYTRVDRKWLRELLDRQASVSLHDVARFSQLTMELLEEFRKQLMPQLPSLRGQATPLPVDAADPVAGT